MPADCVERIHDEVRQRLDDLVAVGADAQRLATDRQVEARFRGGSVELDDLAGHVRQVDLLGMGGRKAREAGELGDHVREAVHLIEDRARGFVEVGEELGSSRAPAGA